MRFFIGHGISAQRLSAEGIAANRPLMPNDSPGNRAKNRRVELIFTRQNMMEKLQNRFSTDVLAPLPLSSEIDGKKFPTPAIVAGLSVPT